MLAELHANHTQQAVVRNPDKLASDLDSSVCLLQNSSNDKGDKMNEIHLDADKGFTLWQQSNPSPSDDNEETQA